MVAPGLCTIPTRRAETLLELNVLRSSQDGTDLVVLESDDMLLAKMLSSASVFPGGMVVCEMLR